MGCLFNLIKMLFIFVLTIVLLPLKLIFGFIGGGFILIAKYLIPLLIICAIVSLFTKK